MLKTMLAACAVMFSFACFAQTSPGFTYGQVPTPAQWNGYFSDKMDYLAPSAAGNCFLSNGTTWYSGVCTYSDTAGNLSGGAAGSIPYQTAPNTTSMLASGLGVLVGGSTPSYSTSPALAGTNFTGIPLTGILSGGPLQLTAFGYPGSNPINPLTVLSANGSVISTSGTTTGGFNEAIAASLSGIGTANSDFFMPGGDASTGGAVVIQLNSTGIIPATQGKHLSVGAITLNANSNVGANSGLQFDSQEMMDFSINGGQIVYQGSGVPVLFKPANGTILDGLYGIVDSNFKFTATAPVAFDWSGHSGAFAEANDFNFGELNSSNASDAPPSNAAFYVPSVGAGNNFGFNFFEARHVHGNIGTGTLWQVGNGTPSSAQDFGYNQYRLNIFPDSSTAATGIDTWEKGSLYEATIGRITTGTTIKLESGACGNIFIVPYNSNWAGLNDSSGCLNNVMLGNGGMYVGGSWLTSSYAGTMQVGSGNAGSSGIMLGHGPSSSGFAGIWNTAVVTPTLSNFIAYSNGTSSIFNGIATSSLAVGGINVALASSTGLAVTGVNSASSFSGAGSGLTGTASALSIGGNAATATIATNLSGGAVAATTISGASIALSGTTGLQSQVEVSTISTNSSNIFGVTSDFQIPATYTGSGSYFRAAPAVAAATTMANLYGYVVSQGTFGSGAAVTNQIGYACQPSMIGATNNRCIQGSIAQAANAFNLYMNGTADNYLAGNLLIGSNSDDGLGNILQVTGTSRFTGIINVPSITINASGRAYNIGTASDTLAAGKATTYESGNISAGAFTMTIAAPTGDGEVRKVCFKNTTGTITWAVTSPATATAGLPTTVIAGQCIQMVYNVASGLPSNSPATTWIVD